MATAIVVRAGLYRDLPAFLTNDSWDYLKAAQDIDLDWNFFSAGLRDVRMPGYSTLLALAHPWLPWRSDAIVLAQSALGIATVAVGWMIGRLLGSTLIAVALASFLAISPPYLLNEHAVMCETVALAFYVLLVAIGLALLRARSDSTLGWAGFGLLLGICTLTRANIVSLGAVLAASACIWQRRLRPALIALTIAGLVVAPWIGRNWSLYGRPTIFGSSNRNLVMYKNMHDPLDATLPTLAGVNARLGYDRVDFEWLLKLSLAMSPAEAETTARRILDEDIGRHPARHAAQMARSAMAYAGLDDTYGDDRAAMRFWFRALVSNVAAMNELGRQVGASLLHDWTFQPRTGDTRWTRLLARAGDRYMWPGRAILSAILLAALTGYLAWALRARNGPARWRFVLVFAVGYGTTLAMHATMLMDYDRYATMFDFLAVLTTALIVDDAVTAVRAHARLAPAVTADGALAPRPGAARGAAAPL